MKSHLQSYSIKLETLSPVFIGSGKEITKKEYIYLPREQKVIIVDIPLFTRFLVKKDLVNSYSEFVLSDQNDLYKWLKDKGIKENEFKAFSSYVIDAADAIKSGYSLKGIQLFIKDNYGKPYIPGSSLKGAIRTAILAKMLSDDRESSNDSLRSFNNSIKNLSNITKNTLKRETEQIETKYLHLLNLCDDKGRPIPSHNAVNSIMKGLQVSDSEPIDTTNLILTRKIDLTTDGKENVQSVFREALRPGVSTKFILTIDEQILAVANITVDYIKTALEDFSQMQEDLFYSLFKTPSNTDYTLANGLELYLGGGVGYVSKTVSYPMGGQNAVEFVGNLMQKQFPPKHKHHKDKSIGISPHMLKGTYYNNKFYKMGRCDMQFLQ